MDALSELINLLDGTDRKLFKQYLQRRNKREDVKNPQLLEMLKTDDKHGLTELYKAKKNKDAYHALRKRLQDSLILFLSQKTFESSNAETYDALRLLIVGRFLLENDAPKIAFKCLRKAEQLAGRLEQFNMLNEILLLKLQYAHVPGAEDLEALSARFTENQLHMQQEARLNMAYAYLRQELQEIHFNGKIVNLSALMVKTIRKYKISSRDLMTYKAVHQILYIANEYAAVQQNYALIERYVSRADKFMQDRAAGASHTFHHISILYFLADFHLRRKDFERSTAHLEGMMHLMMTDSRYHALFHLRHQLLSALNLFYTGLSGEAILLLHVALADAKQTSKPEDIEDLHVSFTMFLALCDDKRSLKHLKLLTRTDAWYEKKMGMLWTIRKNLMEILVQAQFANIELAMSRLSSFRRRYRKYLLKTNEERVLSYLELVEQYLMKPDIAFDAGFQKSVLAQTERTENNDIFTLGFIAWLIARWEKKSAYQVTLKLLQSTT